MVIIGCKSAETGAFQTEKSGSWWILSVLPSTHGRWTASWRDWIGEVGKKSWFAMEACNMSHDDYTYVGTLYPELLLNVKARNLF